MSNFGTKDLYEGVLIANEDVTFGKTSFLQDEIILHLDNVRSLEIIGADSMRAAKGGYENLNLIDWDKIDSVQGMITMGTVNKIATAMSMGLQLQVKNKSLLIPMVENYFVDISGKVKLQHTPFGEVKIFKKEFENRVKQILNFSIEQDTLILEEKGIDIEVNYYCNYQKESEYISVGNSLLDGYFKFVGKFYYTNEVTQEQNTGIIEIPKLKFLLNVKTDLGRNTTPTISNLYFSIIPIGEKKNRNFYNIYYLNEKL